MSKLSIHIIREADGGFMAFCPALPGCMTKGRTREEAQKKIDDAIRGYLGSLNTFIPSSFESVPVEA